MFVYEKNRSKYAILLDGDIKTNFHKFTIQQHDLLVESRTDTAYWNIKVQNIEGHDANTSHRISAVIFFPSES